MKSLKGTPEAIWHQMASHGSPMATIGVVDRGYGVA
jgi:hypothetical protein